MRSNEPPDLTGADTDVRLPLRLWLPVLQESLARGEPFRLPVEGRSMLPTLKPGESVQVVALAGSPRLGEILVFAQGEALIIHRLVHRRGALLVTQGDNLLLPDPPIPAGALVGCIARPPGGSLSILAAPMRYVRAARWVGRYHLLRALRVARRRLF